MAFHCLVQMRRWQFGFPATGSGKSAGEVAPSTCSVVTAVVCFPNMNPYQRPKGLTETAILMSITNAMGWLIVDWSKPHAATIFVLFTIFILVGYLVIWFYWKGRSWARILVLLTSLLCLYNLRFFPRAGFAERLMIGAEAVLAVFLLFWLNTPKVRLFFQAAKHTQTLPTA
jgi:hypothetical protein